MNQAERDIQRKLRILKHAEETGHIARTCRYFGVGRASFYRWKAAQKLCRTTSLWRQRSWPVC
jgi:hypothetical protein